MLSNKDKAVIDEISKKNSNDALIDFWENVLEPYFTQINEQNQKEHAAMMKEIKLLRQDVQGHEMRITRLESNVTN